MARKGGALSLLLAGAAAYGYYKYSKMSEQQKKDLVGGIKEKATKFYDENIPENIKNMIGGKVNGKAKQDQGQTYSQA